MHCHPRVVLTPPPSRPDEERHGQGAFIVSAHNPECRRVALLPFVLALGIPCLVVGCGDGDSKPAPTTVEQGQKIQQNFVGYRDRLIEANKATAKAKTNAAGKSP
jgi:hypothetical protein